MNWAPRTGTRAPRHGVQRRGRDLHRALRRLARPGRDDAEHAPGRATTCARWSRSPAASSSPTRTSASARRGSSATSTARARRGPRALRPGRALPPVDGPAVSEPATSPRYLERPLAPARPGGARRGRLAARSTRPTRCRCAELDRLLDPAPLAGGDRLVHARPTASATSPCAPRCRASRPRWSTGGSTGTRARTLRYRVWHPRGAPRQPRRAAGDRAARKALWGTAHHPGRGHRPRRRSTCGSPSARPTELGFSTDALDDPRVATIVCGLVGDDRRHVQHTRHGPRLPARGRRGRAAQPLLARRGAAARPPGPLGDAAAAAPQPPGRAPRAAAATAAAQLARHCVEEYANLATLLPELYGAYGSDAGR